MKGKPDFTGRFTGRADAYSKYRPRYPRTVLGLLKSETGFGRESTVADIGSGTGILSELFLKNGNVRVHCVEPNDDMRLAAEAKLSHRFPASFRSVKGTAEHTTLADECTDLVSVGQALHWFDLARARREFSRILRPGGHVCVIYNDRLEDEGVMTEYDRIVNTYARNRSNVPDIDDRRLSKLFSSYKKFLLPNKQVLSFEGLVGRVLSASYAPSANDKARTALLRKDLHKLFLKYSRGGRVTLMYSTRVYIGELRQSRQHSR